MRRIGFVSLAVATILTASLAAQAQGIKLTALEAFEHRLEAKLAAPGPYPFEVLFPAPAIYVPGIGVMLSSYVNVAYWQEPSPFRQPFTPQELATLRDHKIAKIPILEKAMRDAMAETAATSDIDPVPPSERIVLGVTLFYFKWENSEGLPRQITMSAQKQELLNAIRNKDKVDLATVIQEQKL
jgi:hypothetical protein